MAGIWIAYINADAKIKNGGEMKNLKPLKGQTQVELSDTGAMVFIYNVTRRGRRLTGIITITEIERIYTQIHEKINPALLGK